MPHMHNMLDSLLYVTNSIRGIPEREVSPLVEYYLKTLQLSEHANKQVQKYSGGNKRKLSLAIALIGSPRILVLGIIP
jgi:ABC-type multidrug transport system ATPase subunit